MYYVYAYLRASNNTPYYIGKGKNKRVFSKHPGISVPNDKTKIVFLEKNLSNVGACALERRYILWYGRKDLGTGILLNRTEGGDGNTGTRSKEWCENHSKKMTGKKFSKQHIEKIKNYDKSYMKTDEYRKKVSDAKKGKSSPLKGRRGFSSSSVKVNTPYGSFSSLREAGDHIGKCCGTIKRWIIEGKEGYSFF
jgi:hypothetical protein